MPGDLFAFGPFQLDAHARRLSRDGNLVTLTARQFDLLHLFVSRAGETLSKDVLIEAAWRDVAVTDNSLEQAISSLRRTLTPPVGQPFIETQARRGYRFAAEVTRLDRRESDSALDALLAPHRAWIEGRAALETLERDQISGARRVFEEVLAHVPDQAPAHVGLANACVLQFETTRADESPDRAALETALHHALEACRLDPQYGEGWATLGFVLNRTGRDADALAAARRATALERDNWRHYLRLAYAGWGEERLRAARRTLALLPGCSLAHWLAATVHIARGADGEAERELVAGIEAQDLAGPGPSRFSGVALHWLLGLIHLARGDEQRARDAFARELSDEGRGHLYARECCANTWYAIGALELRHGHRTEAIRAFDEALGRVPLHPMARLGRGVLQEGGNALSADSGIAGRLSSVDAAVARAAALLLTKGQDGIGVALQVLSAALAAAPAGNAGWLIPVEPLLSVHAAQDAWAPVLARLRSRAA